MNYLQPSEYESFGLEVTTAAAWVTGASAIIDGHCRRASLAVSQYTERLRTGGRRPIQLSYLPLVAVAPATSPIVSVQACYAMPRRGELEGEELAWNVALAFGIPGAWVQLNVADLDYSGEMGQITLPQNALAWTFNELEIVYTAGWETFPNAVKVACAQIARNAQVTPGLNVKKGVLNNMQLWYFSDTLLDDTVRELLAPYVAKKVG